MNISLDDYGHGQKLTEGVMKGMLTHSTNNGKLAELARVHGYSGGAQLGVVVRINHETGAVLGSVFQLFGEDNPVVWDIRTPAKKIWEKAKRRVTLSMEIRVRS